MAVVRLINSGLSRLFFGILEVNDAVESLTGFERFLAREAADDNDIRGAAFAQAEAENKKEKLLFHVECQGFMDYKMLKVTGAE